MNNDSSEIVIRPYETWMKDQVAGLFEIEYGVSAEDFRKLMSRLYEHEFQKNKCILITAVEDQKVVGFQSFFYWPYYWNGKTYNSYQSGNSLVHPNYRGKRLFARMLNYLNDYNIGTEIDFLLGFPVQASYNGFLKNGWKNVFDLQWYVKVINPFAFFMPVSRLKRRLDNKSSFNLTHPSSKVLGLSEKDDFQKWKGQLPSTGRVSYFQYSFTEDNRSVILDIKIQTRKKLVREAIIGNIRFSEGADTIIRIAIRKFIREVRLSGCISIISIAINKSLSYPDISTILTELGFKPINKNIYFILKEIKTPIDNLKPEIWNVGRADIDTW